MRNERGSLLFAVLPLAIAAGGLVLLSATTSRAYLKEHEARRIQVSALNEANAALAVAHARIRASTYTDNSNDAIRNAVNGGTAVNLANVEGNPLKEFFVGERSEAWISELAAGWYQLDVVAKVGKKAAHVRTLLRERDPFSRFSAFVNSHPLGIGGSPKGDIHTNRIMQLFFANGYYEDPVTASEGFMFIVGATEENTTFVSGSNPGIDPISMPSAAQISEMAQFSDGRLDALLNGAPAANFYIKVVLKGQSYDLIAIPKSGSGQTLSALNLGFPTSGVIYIDGDIAALEGTLDARVTIGCTGKITITESIRYLDSLGNPIMLNGLSQDPANEGYDPNPDYTGNAALGVIANGSILYSHQVPDQLEINGVFFSATGFFGLPGFTLSSNGLWATSYDPSFQKQSYRRFGGIITDKRIVSTVVNGSGDVLSGFQTGKSVFDKRLRSYPPPHFLTFDRPLFHGYRILSGAPAGTQSNTESGWNLNDKPIGSIAKELQSGQ